MWSDVYVVIGDLFKDFTSVTDTVVTESQMIDKMLSAAPPARPVRILLEQGVNATSLYLAAAKADPSRRLFRLELDALLPRAVDRLSHKRRPENVLVSWPRPVGNSTYELDLHFNTASEFFSDHMTGLHIQGMALMEAARQSFLVVTEEVFLRDDERKFYFVIKSFTSRFLSFVFPLRASIVYEIVSHRPKEDRHGFEVTMKVVQGDTVCAEFDVAFTAFLASAIAAKETELAGRLASEVTQRLAAMADTAEGLPVGALPIDLATLPAASGALQAPPR